MSGFVLAIFGPTASGKSAVAEALADRVDAELVSADAMQAYRGLPILTNQSERPTRLVGIWPLDHEGSVGEYQRLAHAAIDEILTAGRVPAGSACTTRRARNGRTPRWPPATPLPPARFTPTTAAASSARSSWRRPAPRSGPRETGSGSTRPAIRRWSSVSTTPTRPCRSTTCSRS